MRDLYSSSKLRAMICFVVRALTGNELEIAFNPDSSTDWKAVVQKKIAEELRIPHRFQKLLHGVRDLTHDNETHFSTYLEDDGYRIVLSIVVSLEDACQTIATGTTLQTATVLNDFAHLGNKGGPVAIAVVSERLEHDKWSVRRAAVDALAQLAEKGDQRTITAVSERLDDDDWSVRRAAVDALAQLAEKGDQRTINAVSERLDESDWNVRWAAVNALSQLAEKGDQHVLKVVSERLDDDNWKVRRSAVDALAELTEKGDQRTIAAVSERLDDDHGNVNTSQKPGNIRLLK